MPRIKWKGEDLGHWGGKPTLKECRKIKADLGMTPVEFQDRFEELDADAWSMFVALMLNRNGKPVNFEDIDGEYDDLELIPDKDEQAAIEEAQKVEEGKAPPLASETSDSDESKPSSSTPDSPTST